MPKRICNLLQLGHGMQNLNPTVSDDDTAGDTELGPLEVGREPQVDAELCQAVVADDDDDLESVQHLIQPSGQLVQLRQVETRLVAPISQCHREQLTRQ